METRTYSEPSIVERNGEITELNRDPRLDQIQARIAEYQNELAELNRQHQETISANFKRANQIEGAIMALKELLTPLVEVDAPRP